MLDSAHCSQTAARGGLRVTVVRGRHAPPGRRNKNKTVFDKWRPTHTEIIVAYTKLYGKTARDADLESDDSSGGEEEEEEEGGEEEEEEGGEGGEGEEKYPHAI